MPYIQKYLMRLPILKRLLIGNTIVILIGAIGGTLLTRYLTLIGNLDLIFVFSILGITLTVLVNYWIIKRLNVYCKMAFGFIIFYG